MGASRRRQKSREAEQKVTDELQRFIDECVEDTVSQRQLRYILTHPGKAARTEEQQKAFKKRRKIWKKYENQFVSQVLAPKRHLRQKLSNK